MNLLLQANGCKKLWNGRDPKDVTLEQGTVLTLLLTPDSDTGLPEGKLCNFNYDTTLHVVTAHELVDWKCKVTNNEIYPKIGVNF